MKNLFKGFLLLIFILWLAFHGKSDKPATPKDSANEMRVQAITYSNEKLKSLIKDPESFNAPWSPDRVIIGDDSSFIIDTHFHANNGLGLRVNNSGIVRLRYLGGDMNNANNWEFTAVFINDEQIL